MPIVGVNDDLTLGYGGAGKITVAGNAEVQVLITGGSWSATTTPTYVNAIDILPTNVTRSKMLHAPGTITETVNITFDITDESLVLIDQIFERNKLVDVEINDHNTGIVLEECKATAVTLSGAAGGLISCSMDLISIGPATINTALAAFENDFIRDQEPLGYWYSGNTDVREWTLAMNQEASLVFPNDTGQRAHYIKVARWGFQLDVTTYQDIQTHSSIAIKTDSWTLQGETVAEGYTFNGQTDFGMFSHSITTSADITVGAGDIILT
jgi:hypothetical protein